MNVLTKIERFFRSVKLMVSLLLLIAVTCLIGTIVTQTPTTSERPRDDVMIAGRTVGWLFHWHDIYRSPFFIGCLVLLAVNVLVCSLKTFRRLDLRNVGWILTHGSIIVILAGIVIGQLTGDTGLMKVHEGESGSVITRDDGTQFDLTFNVTLDRFDVEYYDEPTERLIIVRDGIEKSVPVTNRREHRLDDGSASVQITDRVPHATMTALVAEDANSDLNPAIRVVLEGSGRSETEWVFAADEKETVLFESAISVRYVWCDTEATYRNAVRGEEVPEQEKLHVRLPGSDAVESFPIEIRKPFRVDRTGYVLEILRHLPDFRLDKGTGQPISASDNPRNPAIEVSINDGKRVVTRWVFSRFPDFWRAHHDENETSLELRYVRPTEYALRIVELNGQGISLVGTGFNRSAHVEPIQVGEEVKLAKSGWNLTLAERVVRPKVVRTVIPSHDPRAEPAIQVRLTGTNPRTEDSLWLMANVPDEIGTTELVYSREFVPKQYASDIRFIAGEREIRGTVKVNAPLRFGGFAFYQSSYGDDGSAFSVLQVKKDVGAPCVYLGFVLLSVGLVYGFYVGPTLAKRAGRVSE